MRRLIIEEPVSRAALLSRRAAVFGIALAAIGVAAARGGTDPLDAFALVGAGLLSAVLALLAAMVAAVVIWRTGRPGIGQALGGAALAVALLAYPAWLATEAAGLPDIDDVSTDWTDPPLFSAAPKAVAARRGAQHPVPPDDARQEQARAYPELRPLTFELDAAEAYKAALRLVASRRWAVIEAQPPVGHPAAGHIDAVARTPIMGFRDDVTIRIVAVSAEQSRVDLRSASRTGQRDLGTNATRLEAFASDLDDAADQ